MTALGVMVNSHLRLNYIDERSKFRLNSGMVIWIEEIMICSTSLPFCPLSFRPIRTDLI